MKHTHGPWYVSKKNPTRVVESGPRGLTLARVYARGVTAAIEQAEAEANARLIAAAPELLRVMELVASGLEADGRTLDGMTKAVAAVKLRAAIANATGELT